MKQAIDTRCVYILWMRALGRRLKPAPLKIVLRQARLNEAAEKKKRQ